jgi:hypothetical protein
MDVTRPEGKFELTRISIDPAWLKACLATNDLCATAQVIYLLFVKSSCNFPGRNYYMPAIDLSLAK